MNLKQGIVKTDKITITPHTTLSDVLSVFKDIHSCITHKNSDIVNVKITEPIIIEKRPFNIIFVFNNKQLLSLRLSPQLNYPEHKSSHHSERRKEHYFFCIKWLKRYFQDREGEEQTVKAYFRSNYDFCDGNEHGYIFIEYPTLTN